MRLLLLAAVVLLTALLPTAQARAEAICACYYGDNDNCEYFFDEDGFSFPTSRSECNLFCIEDDRHPDTTNIDWAQDSDSEAGIDVGADCDEAEELAASTEGIVGSGTSSSSGTSALPLITPRLEVPIPDLSFAQAVADSNVVTSNFIGEYVTGVYKFLIGFAVTIAIVMMMVGGLQYVIGASSGEIGKAKDRIKNAIVGLVLLLFVYVILFTVNPQTTLFSSLELKYIKEIPSENFFEPTGADAVACTATGADLTGVNEFQDCMLSKFGASEAEARSQLVSVTYKSRTYQVHALIKDDFEAALAAVDASGVSYDITQDSSGGTFNWRCNKNYPTAVSSHSWGTAIDINPSTNPNCPPGCADNDASTSCTNCVGGTSTTSCETMCGSAQPYDIPQEVVDAFVNNGFSWGGKYRKTKDYMHFTHTRICQGG